MRWWIILILGVLMFVAGVMLQAAPLAALGVIVAGGGVATWIADRLIKWTYE